MDADIISDMLESLRKKKYVVQGPTSDFKVEFKDIAYRFESNNFLSSNKHPEK